MDYMEKWCGTVAYSPAVRALEVIADEIPNPSYKQITEVLECMRDISATESILTTQK